MVNGILYKSISKGNSLVFEYSGIKSIWVYVKGASSLKFTDYNNKVYTIDIPINYPTVINLPFEIKRVEIFTSSETPMSANLIIQKFGN